MSRRPQAAPPSAREEALAPEKVDRDSIMFRRLGAIIKPYRLTFAACLLLLPAISGLSLVQPWIIQQAIDHHYVPRQIDGLGLLLLAYAATLVGEFALRFVQFYLMEHAGQRALRDLRCQVFEHMQRLKIAFFHRNPVGRLMTRLTTDVDSLQEALSSGVVTIIGDVFTLVGIVVILLARNWHLALVTFAVVPLLIGISVIFRILMRRAYRLLRVKIASLNALLQESVTGMSVIQLFTAEGASRQQYDAVNQDHRDASFQSIRYDAILYALAEMISSIAIASIIWFGAGEAASDLITLGALVAFIEYVQKFFIPIRELSQKYALVQSALASAERIFGILDEDDLIPEDPDPLPIKALAEKITFEDVWFSYQPAEEGRWVLKGVSFEIARGQKVAIVGHTGAGKSTLIGLLTRMVDVQRGRILIDGVDIRRLRLADLRALFSIVLQDGFLFTGSVRDNIAMHDPAMADADIRRAAAIVGVDKIIERAPEGYDRHIQERGSNLSTGERQLVTFARALARDPDVLILDEATANVDTETEALIDEAVAAMLAQQTSVVIAHRLSTIQRADQIIVLHKGEVAEVGAHASLMAREGLYNKLVTLQKARMNDTEPTP